MERILQATDVAAPKGEVADQVLRAGLLPGMQGIDLRLAVRDRLQHQTG